MGIAEAKNKILQNPLQNFKMKSTILSTVFFVVIASFCLSNAFILYDGSGRAVRVQREVIPMKTDLNNFVKLYGSNLPRNQVSHNIRPLKPEPNQYWKNRYTCPLNV